MSTRENPKDLVLRIKSLVPYLNGKYSGPKKMQDDRYLILLYGATMIDEFRQWGTKQGRLLYFPYNQLKFISKSRVLSSSDPLIFESTRTARKRAYPSLRTKKMVRIERIDVPGYNGAECVAITKKGIDHASTRINEIENGFSEEVREVQQRLIYQDNWKLDEDSNDANAWLENGIGLDESGRHLEAIQCYNKALQIDRNNAVTWNNKGKSLIHLKNYDKAFKCLDKCLQIDRNYAFAWDNLAWAYTNLGHYDESLQCTERALQIAPNYATALFRKGSILRILGKTDKAEEYFDRARQLGYEG